MIALIVVDLSSVRLDMILCGSAHSGKSSGAMVMIDVLTQMEQQHHLQASRELQKLPSTSNEFMSAQAHKLYR